MMIKKKKGIVPAATKTHNNNLPFLLFFFVLLAILLFAMGAEAEIAYDEYAQVLSKYVDAGGKVDYAGLKADPAKLDSFLDQIARENIASYNSSQKIAFWINAYNAYTLKAVIDHYPVSSIKKIPGVWDKMKWDVAGRSLTLNDIEHEILRKKFNEPRIHFALVCASVGCPALHKEPFTGAELDTQLKDQTKRFLSVKNNFRVEGDTVYLSAIFKWFGDDFISGYKTNETFPGNSEKERAILNFVSSYESFGAKEKVDIKYTSYDWSLNKK
jgi:hypothetical protein